MKKIYLSLIILFLLCVNIKTADAQSAFDAKKRKESSVNTSSLQARKVTAAMRGSSTARANQTIFQSPKSFGFQSKERLHRILHSNEGHPVFIETKRNTASSRVFVRKDSYTACYDYLQELSPILQVENVKESFTIRRTKDDRYNGTHIKLQQLYKGVPVHGAEVMVHLNSFGEGQAFNGRYITPLHDIDVVPSVAMQTVIDRVRADVSKGNSIRHLTAFEKTLVQYDEPEATLCIYEDKSLVKSNVLAYHIVYSPAIHKRMEYFVDAHTGNVLRSINTVCFVDGPKTATANDLNGVSQTVNTYQVGANYYLLDASRAMFNVGTSNLPDEPVGGILTVDMDNTFGDDASILHVTTTNNVWNTANHAKAVSAHFNAGKAFEYFFTHHDRNSINGKGGTMLSLINVSDPDNGEALDNAFWNGKAMFYGNGNIALKPLAGGLDVAGHEMTHGVIENTANLDYEGESGAINESLADIFGSMIDPDDWRIGEDVAKLATYPSGAVRSLEDPHNGRTTLGQPGFQPMHMDEKYTGNEDNGGVHINSGITNHAFYKYAEAITRDKAADVFYKALDDYLTKSSQFIDLRLAVIKAAGDLFGATSTEVNQAKLAFDAVGITDGQGGDYEEPLPPNPGGEFLLINNTDPNNSNSLYRVNSTFVRVDPLTTTALLSRPSVTDDGSIAVFVAGDRTIHAIVTAPGQTPDEFVLQNEPIWSNVAVSKDGNRMAAVTEDEDNTIFVYDFVTEEWGEFQLYNPTYSDGINSGGTEFADALEWDYTGEYVVYDAFNRIENNSGSDIEYWDVNFIRAWDKTADDFGDGTIQKLFSNLPEGVSIGNPTFAKLSPYILAFDMVDESTNEYYVLGSNIETGETDVIYTNTGLGFPSFSKNDDRVAFTIEDGVDLYHTGFVNLNGNKISSADTEATTLFEDSKWAVYFTAGERDIDDDVTGVEQGEKNVTLTCFPNPFEREISMKLTQDFIGGGKVEVTNVMGQRVFNMEAGPSSEEMFLGFDNLPAGQYIVRINDGKSVGSCRVVKIN
ncbi:MAG TPA: M4 family metallopeptidase [Chryseolinea sp.]|nr:M4 family metallopeptidase [Chryseolinea sp.]